MLASNEPKYLVIQGAKENNLKNIDLRIRKGKITVITGVSGSGKSSLAFDTILAEAQRRFFYTLSHYSRQFLDIGSKPDVRSISGLSPAIGLMQTETNPSAMASVGTLTDLGELIGVLFSRAGIKLCPKHLQPTQAMSVAEMAQNVMERMEGQMIAICAPAVQDKKGTYQDVFQKFARKGYLRAVVDGEICDLSPAPALDKNKKHSISVVIDYVAVQASNRNRIVRAMTSALEEGGGYGEYYATRDQAHEIDVATLAVFSAKNGCPTCGLSWPMLDTRHFSKNSLGKCMTCEGYGHLNAEDEEGEVVVPELCESCRGTGLNPDLKAIRIGDYSAVDFHDMALTELRTVCERLRHGSPIAHKILEEIVREVTPIVEIGLGYIQCRRSLVSLSRGELQRLRLSGILGKALRGVLFVMDEPSQGLHPRELEKLWEALERLKDLGNTIILVDHDEYLIRKADCIIDMGPGGGDDGGAVMGIFSADEAARFPESTTARYLLRPKPILSPSSKQNVKDALVIKGANLFNLRIPSVKFPLGQMSVVTGVSGAGKTTLTIKTCYHNLRRKLLNAKAPILFCKEFSGWETVRSCHLVDRKQMARSGVSMPATYLDVFKDLREFYTKLPQAQIAGITAKDFSLVGGEGRCEECLGKGQISLNMKFLAEAKVVCPVCEGKRYKLAVLDVQWNGYSLSDILDLTVSQAAELFSFDQRMARKLAPARAMGLGYLKLGQLSRDLSGGEAQRLKLSQFFNKNIGKGDVVFLDEPTSGLHMADVEKLMDQLNALKNRGVTIIIIEHQSDVIAQADHVIELGPGSGAQGGRLIDAEARQ
jgi:excinuclease ABC subunit A